MLVINQLNKDWPCSSEKMDAYCTKIRKLEGKFYGIEYHHVVRDQNQPADQLSKIGSSRTAVPPGVFMQDLMVPSIKEEKDVEEVTDWREQFIKYLTNSEVPADKTDTERLIHRSKHYVLVDGNLMRKSAKEGVLQKCVPQDEGVKLLHEIHSGSCGNHAASRNLVGKAFRAGFY